MPWLLALPERSSHDVDNVKWECSFFESESELQRQWIRSNANTEIFFLKKYPVNNGLITRGIFVNMYLPFTVQCPYNAVDFLQNHHKRLPIARLLRRAMGCLLWVKTYIHILPQSPQLWWVQYHAMNGPHYNGIRLYMLNCSEKNTRQYSISAQDLFVCAVVVP